MKRQAITIDNAYAAAAAAHINIQIKVFVWMVIFFSSSRVCVCVSVCWTFAKHAWFHFCVAEKIRLPFSSMEKVLFINKINLCLSWKLVYFFLRCCHYYSMLLFLSFLCSRRPYCFSLIIRKWHNKMRAVEFRYEQKKNKTI